MSQKVEIPNNIHCTKSHEYVILDGDTGTIGITNYAAEQLGEIVYVEMPEIDTEISKGEVFGTVESVKAASELYSPVSGKVIEVNERLATEPELINDDCYNEGWIVKLSGVKEKDLSETLNMDKYLEFIKE